ncbi:hypothetical protein [Pedobacter frigoris]|uniref:hypothetical protein n=1 Tax=Pedobacter frigoris TaxID=2571272 RepID=UPI002930C885|nr:hypothetical protein [Pedobacter frigoris]
MKKVYLSIPGEPIDVLLAYLHSKMELTATFDETIVPMLTAFTPEKTYHCKKLEKVMRTAYWVHTGYAYITIKLQNKEGIPVQHLVDILGPGKIMLHPDGFFNNEETACEFWITPGSIVVPFTQQNFGELKLSATEASALAACILAENATLSLIKSCMLKLPGLMLLQEMNRIFGKLIWQHFSQHELSNYTGITKSHLCRIKNRV